MSHLGEKITVDERRAIESAILCEYGEITINGEVGKKCAANYDKKFYTEGITATADWTNKPTSEVITDDQDVYFVLWTTMTGFTVTRDGLREYTSKKVEDTVVLTHKRATC